MGPSREEVVAVATDLITRFGPQAHEEARRLEQVAVRLRYPSNRDLYRRAAREIEKRVEASGGIAADERPPRSPISDCQAPIDDEYAAKSRAGRATTMPIALIETDPSEPRASPALLDLQDALSSRVPRVGWVIAAAPFAPARASSDSNQRR